MYRDAEGTGDAAPPVRSHAIDVEIALKEGTSAPGALDGEGSLSSHRRDARGTRGRTANAVWSNVAQEAQGTEEEPQAKRRRALQFTVGTYCEYGPPLQPPVMRRTAGYYEEVVKWKQASLTSSSSVFASTTFGQHATSDVSVSDGVRGRTGSRGRRVQSPVRDLQTRLGLACAAAGELPWPCVYL